MTIRVCVACRQADPVHCETVLAADVIAGWEREWHVSGATAGHERVNALLSALPDRIEFYQCRGCGLAMADPSTVWPAAAYPRDQSYPFRWEFRRSVDDLGPAPLDVLEIGCGTGHFLAAAAARGHRVVGIDFSDTAVAEARARGVRAFCGGFDELGRHLDAEARFDAVAFFQVIEHLADPDVLLSSLGTWVRPSARLFLSCPGPRRFTRLIDDEQAGESDYWDYPPHHVLRWTLPALGTVLDRHGWEIVTAMEEPFSWIAAASHVGVARAIHHGHLRRPLLRRASIAAAWVRLLLAPARRAGMSLYVAARRTGPQA
jgi:SAM-dependent methyltransferase